MRVPRILFIPLILVTLIVTCSQGPIPVPVERASAVPSFLTLRFAAVYSNLVDEKGKVKVSAVFLGSGVFVNGSEVLTARHVVEARDWGGNSKYVPYEIGFIESFDGREYRVSRIKVKSVRSSSTTDLALITLAESREGIPDLSIGDDLPVTSTLYTLSAPYGEITYSTGILHSYARIYYASDSSKLLIIQHWHPDKSDFNVYTFGHNLTVGPGSSGGGVFTPAGALVGVHVASAVRGNLGYAVTVKDIREFLRDAR